MEQPPPQPGSRRRCRIAGVFFALTLVAVTILAFVTREHFWAKRFAVVEAGALYRGAYPEPWPLERLIRSNGIREILCLLDGVPPEEERVAEEQGVRVINIPMPGNGCADFDSLDRAADVIRDAKAGAKPLFVHCAAGVQRTNAAIVAYRLKHCGWTYDRAIAEAQQYWLDRKENPELFEHLKQYARRVTSRPAGQPAS